MTTKETWSQKVIIKDIEQFKEQEKMYDLAQAIKDLIIEYDKACKLDFVNFPIGYALYQTWKKYDLDYRKVEEFKEQDK